MCVKWTGEWEVTAKDITAFKAVLREGKQYKSSVPVSRRDPQQQPGTIGEVLYYRKGRYADSDEPGIYCFLTPAMAQDHHDEEGIAVIEVKIPKGTRIRRGRAVIRDEEGRGLELLTINALRVKVIRELDEKTVKKALWPAAQPVSDEYIQSSGINTWSYFTASATTTTICYSSWVDG